VGLRGVSVTQGASGLLRPSGKWLGFSGALASWGLGSGEGLATGGGILRPQPGEQEEPPHQSDAYEFGAK
jgi:hypothetical protein